MSEKNSRFHSIILAGERPERSALCQAFNVPASVLVPVAGKSSLSRVLETIRDSEYAEGAIICGPALEVLQNSEVLTNLLHHSEHEWLQPATGPAASALLALDKLERYPALLTTGDHALLTARIVDDFCVRALACSRNTGCDIVLGLVPYLLVKAAWPKSRRTVLKFSNGYFCGSNLFAVLDPNGRKGLSFWRQAEADRKYPWRIARRFGALTLLRYLCRRLTLEDALQSFSEASGCKIGFIQLDFARAAVDVDSVEDQLLAEKILSAQSPDAG